MSAKTGPKTEWLDGLRVSRTKNRKGESVTYYYHKLPDGKRKNFGSDPQEAVKRFKAWQRESEQKEISFAQYVPDTNERTITDVVGELQNRKRYIIAELFRLLDFRARQLCFQLFDTILKSSRPTTCTLCLSHDSNLSKEKQN
jgi:hypothetical protein